MRYDMTGMRIFTNDTTFDEQGFMNVSRKQILPEIHDTGTIEGVVECCTSNWCIQDWAGIEGEITGGDLLYQLRKSKDIALEDINLDFIEDEYIYRVSVSY